MLTDRRHTGGCPFRAVFSAKKESPAVRNCGGGGFRFEGGAQKLVSTNIRFNTGAALLNVPHPVAKEDQEVVPCVTIIVLSGFLRQTPYWI